MKKRLFSLFLLLTLCFQLSYAYDYDYAFPMLVKINDTYIKVDDFIFADDVYYVPAEQLANSLRVIVERKENSRKVSFIKLSDRLVVFNHRAKMYRNDEYVGIDLSVRALNRNGKIYLPLVYFSEFFGAEVSYSEKYNTYTISDAAIAVKDDAKLLSEELDEQLLWLARIVNIEARGDSLYKKLAVAGVVMNRVNSKHFPNTVYDVIKAKGQFPPAYYSYFDTFTPDTASYTAAVHALNGENVIEDCLYFNLKPFKWKPKEDFYREIEGDYFYH